MAASSGAARAAASDTRLVSPLAFAEINLAETLHSVSPTPLSFAANDNADALASWSVGCGCGCGKRYTDFFQDGVGDGPRPVQPPVLLVTTDIIADDTSTDQTLTVDGAHVTSTLDTIGDQDFFAVQLVAGQTYDISMFLVMGGPSGVPLADAYIELYDSAGNFLVSADGGGPNTPSGLDAILTYTAESSGTFYINARAYDQEASNGTRGDFVGDYEVFVTSVDENDPAAYVPFYSPNSPLHSIDWGTQFDRTVRNPDGDNGTRDNGVPDTGVIVNPTYGVVGKNVITYYFAEQGDVFVSEDPLNPGLETTLQARNMEQWEQDAFLAAFNLYEQVADLEYIRVNSREEADIKIILYEGTPGAGASLLGRMSPPNTSNEGQMEINSGDYRWTEEGVSPGGFYFPTLLHELGHGHGMAHPHDNGGRSSIMRGAGPSEDPVEGAIGGQHGDFDLSQQVYTIMSYNDGWNDTDGVGGRPDGHGGPRSGGLQMQADHFGWMGTLAALDIAVLQDKYGVNEEWATGDDVYTISDVNEAGNFYSTIWDGGGDDEIRYVGDRDATIDLRAATLQYEEGGGGRMSFAFGAWTGFTIANGVAIERATGGNGDDRLTGNAGDNILAGRGGVDVLIGGDGVDTADYSAAAAGMRAQLNSGAASIDGDGGSDSLSGIENLTGSAFDDVLIGSGGANVLNGGLGADVLAGLAGNDILIGGGGLSNQMQGGLGDDRYVVSLAGDTLVEFAGEGVDTVETDLAAYTLKAEFEALVLTRAGGATGVGNAGANAITGGVGNDVLSGRGGIDALDGGAGVDTADYSAAAAGMRAQLNTGVASNDGDGGSDSLSRFENVTGSAFNDVLIGAGGANVLNGGLGADVLLGLNGDDVLIGGAGAANQMQGGMGDDRYVVTTNDTLVEAAGEGTDTVETTLGAYALRANFENLTYTGAGNFTGTGNELNNVISGGNGADVLRGGGGNDDLIGGAGNDLAVLSGDRADYTVVQEADGVYRITDGVGGRDGVDLANGVERVRFADGTTALLSDLATPAAPMAASAKDYDAQILPGLLDDDFIVTKTADQPLVLPGDGLPSEFMMDEAAPQGRFGGGSNRMLSLFDDDGGFLADPVGLLKPTDGLDDWM
ncbi:matrixin family metalloprotease [Brevundimonas sp.]|uniref:matrixin family metalloprotease n=1 Tax=Brevundimonas sp. TaxID=1871086 RepID=UPI002D3AF036|nr:matrixin family metalloprotease [Brevundimonas sp.]HYC75437.1 matrixin family metalloprotease [Brevundimonas sp.]